jgi:hypothetical protein
MDAVTYPQEKVARLVNDHFVPVRIPRNESLEQTYRVPWTPTVVVLDANGRECFREIGYLPPDDFLAHMNLALGRAAFEERDFESASRFYQTIVDEFAASEMVPEALYFLGLARNKMAGGTVDDRRAIWRRIIEEHPKSDWAKKASVAFE